MVSEHLVLDKPKLMGSIITLESIDGVSIENRESLIDLDSLCFLDRYSVI